ncbi:efflux RND transporter periplasmic adaptor subunit [Tahibacter caeni]|uniref:efflux RND transporter periplasmic adaptor subunit n=1 Tax=Tahibacter caeni TaxID=1453545 RepID=UPI00214887B2|nr:efflux RND transporter periplasmic adaptor subunit [Tahibacter caeni]
MNEGSIWLRLRGKPLYLLLAATLFAVALWSFWPRALPVESAAVAAAPLTESFSEEGRTRLRSRYQLGAPLDGTVERIVAEPGDAVAAGDVVAVLRPSPSAMLDPAGRAQSEARVRAAESDLAAARATVASARAEQSRSAAALQRGIALGAKGLLSGENLDSLRAQDAAAAAALRSAQARVDAAVSVRDGYRAVLELQGDAATPTRLPLRAPVAGRIIRRFVESEVAVRAGQALLDLGDIGALEVVADVLTADAVRLQTGTPARLRDWGGETPLHGRVRRVEPGGFTKVSALGVDEQRTVVVVEFDEAAETPALRARLGDGFRVQVDFLVWQSPSVLQVPSAALFRDDAAWAAYVIENGRARLRRIELGRIGDGRAEVRGGLREGDRVVLFPADTVRDGRRVTAQSP